MKNTLRISFALCVALAVFACLPSAVQAELIGSGVTVAASNGTKSGTYYFELPEEPTYPYNWSGYQEIWSTDSSTLLGHIDGFSVTYIGDPQVLLGFAVGAGALPTAFTITSSTLTFPTIVNGQAFAQASITLTDADSDGASLTGQFPAGKAYQARYGLGGPPTSSFADLISTPILAAPDDGTTVSQRFPPISPNPSPVGPLDRIQSEYSFILSANDTASGTSNFNVVPEPSSVVLLASGLVGLGLFAKRARARRR